MSENLIQEQQINIVFCEKIKYMFKMQEDVFLSDLIFPSTRPEFRNLIETFSTEAFSEVQTSLIRIYGDEIKTRFEHFWGFCSDNYIHPIEILAMKNDIELIEDENPRNLVRRFGRLKRIKIVDINSEEFHHTKFNRFFLVGDSKFMIAIDKRFKFDKLEKYFSNLGDKFYQWTPEKVKY